MYTGDSARSGYRADTNLPLAPFDPQKPVKRWAVTSNVPRVIHSWAFGDRATRVSHEYTPAQLAEVNIPGLDTYPTYKPLPSGAFILANGTRHYLHPDGLSSKEDAERIASELRAAGWKVDDVRERVGLGFVIQYEEFELRRAWMVIVDDAGAKLEQQAGQMVKVQYRNGVGAPGRWSTPAEKATESPIPAWISAPQLLPPPGFSLLPEALPPMRELRADEEFRQLFGGTWAVVLKGTPQTGTGTGTGTGTTGTGVMDPAIATLIRETHGNVGAVLALLQSGR